MSEHRPRILVVEDDYFVAMHISEVLRTCPAEPLGPVSTVGEAREAVENEPLDGIILDVKLREEDTLSLADELVDRRITIVFSTGYQARAGRCCRQASRVPSEPELVGGAIGDTPSRPGRIRATAALPEDGDQRSGRRGTAQPRQDPAGTGVINPSFKNNRTRRAPLERYVCLQQHNNSVKRIDLRGRTWA